MKNNCRVLNYTTLATPWSQSDSMYSSHSIAVFLQKPGGTVFAAMNSTATVDCSVREGFWISWSAYPPFMSSFFNITSGFHKRLLGEWGLSTTTAPDGLSSRASMHYTHRITPMNGTQVRCVATNLSNTEWVYKTAAAKFVFLSMYRIILLLYVAILYPIVACSPA